MPLPSTGPISMSMVNKELGKSESTNISLNNADVRKLAGKPSGVISMSDLRGKGVIEETYTITVARWTMIEGYTYDYATGDTLGSLSPKEFMGSVIGELMSAWGGVNIWIWFKYPTDRLKKLKGIRITINGKVFTTDPGYVPSPGGLYFQSRSSGLESIWKPGNTFKVTLTGIE